MASGPSTGSASTVLNWRERRLAFRVSSRRQLQSRCTWVVTEIGSTDARVLRELSRRALEHLRPEVDHKDGITHCMHQIRVVLDEQQSHSRSAKAGARWWRWWVP